jgi:O-antigen/teichoic acid export membrane protein
MFGRSLTALLTVASIAIFSRLLSPTEYGILTLTLTSAGIFNALFCTWVAQSVFRLYPEVSIQIRLQSTGMLALVASAGLSATVALITIGLSGKIVSAELVAGTILLFTGFSFYEYSNIQLTAQQRPIAFAQLQLTRLMLGLLLPLCAWITTTRLDYLILALGMSYWLPLLIPRFSTWMSGAAYRHVDWDLLRSIARYGLPLSCSLLLLQLGVALDRYILGAYHGIGSVAGYAAGADLALFAIGMIASSLSQAFYPKLLQFRAESESSANENLLYSDYISYFIAVVLPACIGLYFVADELAWLVVGPSIRTDTAASLTIFAATAFVLNFKSFIVDVRFQIVKKLLFPMISAIVTIVLVTILGFWQIPSNAAIGAAWTSLIAISGGCLVAIVASIFITGKMPIKMYDLSKIMLSTVVMAGTLYILDNIFLPALALPLMISAGVGVYALALFALNFPPVRNGVKLLLSSLMRPTRA